MKTPLAKCCLLASVAVGCACALQAQEVTPKPVATAKYVRWTVTQWPKSNPHSNLQCPNTGLGVSEFKLRKGDADLTWPSGTSITAAPEKAGTDQNSAKIIDGNLSSDSKYYNNPSPAPEKFVFTITSSIPVSFDGYSIYAADQDGRNPQAWTLEASADGETWTEIGSESLDIAVLDGWDTKGANQRKSFEVKTEFGEPLPEKAVTFATDATWSQLLAGTSLAEFSSVNLDASTATTALTLTLDGEVSIPVLKITGSQPLTINTTTDFVDGIIALDLTAYTGEVTLNWQPKSGSLNGAKAMRVDHTAAEDKAQTAWTIREGGNLMLANVGNPYHFTNKTITVVPTDASGDYAVISLQNGGKGGVDFTGSTLNGSGTFAFMHKIGGEAVPNAILAFAEASTFTGEVYVSDQWNKEVESTITGTSLKNAVFVFGKDYTGTNPTPGGKYATDKLLLSGDATLKGIRTTREGDTIKSSDTTVRTLTLAGEGTYSASKTEVTISLNYTGTGSQTFIGASALTDLTIGEAAGTLAFSHANGVSVKQALTINKALSTTTPTVAGKISFIDGATISLPENAPAGTYKIATSFDDAVTPVIKQGETVVADATIDAAAGTVTLPVVVLPIKATATGANATWSTLTWTDSTGTITPDWGSYTGVAEVTVDGETTLTVDKEFNTCSMKFTGSGPLTLNLDTAAGYIDNVKAIDVTNVTGGVTFTFKLGQSTKVFGPHTYKGVNFGRDFAVDGIVTYDSCQLGNVTMNNYASIILAGEGRTEKISTSEIGGSLTIKGSQQIAEFENRGTTDANPFALTIENTGAMTINDMTMTQVLVLDYINLTVAGTLTVPQIIQGQTAGRTSTVVVDGGTVNLFGINDVAWKIASSTKITIKSGEVKAGGKLDMSGALTMATIVQEGGSVSFTGGNFATADDMGDAYTLALDLNGGTFAIAGDIPLRDFYIPQSGQTIQMVSINLAGGALIASDTTTIGAPVALQQQATGTLAAAAGKTLTLTNLIGVSELINVGTADNAGTVVFGEVRPRLASVAGIVSFTPTAGEIGLKMASFPTIMTTAPAASAFVCPDESVTVTGVTLAGNQLQVAFTQEGVAPSVTVDGDVDAAVTTFVNTLPREAGTPEGTISLTAAQANLLYVFGATELPADLTAISFGVTKFEVTGTSVAIEATPKGMKLAGAPAVVSAQVYVGADLTSAMLAMPMITGSFDGTKYTFSGQIFPNMKYFKVVITK